MSPGYRYRCTITRVIDGDTLVGDVDLGFYTWVRDVRLRLRGVNCPELKTPEGIAARDFVERTVLWKPNGSMGPTQAVIDTVKPDKYGNRWDAVVWLADGGCLNVMLVGAGHAVRVKSEDQS